MRSRCLRLLSHPRRAKRQRPGFPFQRNIYSRYIASLESWNPAHSSHKIGLVGKESDISHSDLSQDERRLLGRARLHDIFTLEKLLFEVNLGHSLEVGSRMTDKPNLRQDLELWKLIMDVNKHYHGIDGLKATWRGMRHRGVQVQLQSDNATALELWQAFITGAAIEDIKFLRQICWNCREKGMLQDRIFIDVVSTLLTHQPKFAPEFASSLRQTYFLGREVLLKLFEAACQSTTKGSLQAFRDLRSVFPDMRIYREVVPYLCSAGRTNDALVMHNYLLSKQDLPRTFDDLAPLIEHFASTGARMDAFLHNLRAAGVSFESQIRRLYSRRRARLVGFHPETMNIVASHTFGMTPRKLKDETVARAFATPGFSFDFVLKFLQPFGFIEMGPSAVRQMAMTSADQDDLKARFAKLDQFGIDLGSSAYVRIMKKLAASGPSEMVRALSNTDMHHDEFEDRELQISLFHEYVKKRDLRQINRSLAILNFGDVTSKACLNAANLMLRAAIIQGDWTAVIHATEMAQRHGHRVGKSIMRLLIQSLLAPPRNRQKISVVDFDRVAFVVGILQRLLIAGNEVQPGFWVWPILELGHQGRLDEVDRLLLWLAQYYQELQKYVSYGAGVPRLLNSDLSKLFSTTILNAVVSWSITKEDWDAVFTRYANQHTDSKPEPWLRGAVLLKSLRDKFGVAIDVTAARRVFVSRLKAMYTSRELSRLELNRRSAAVRGVRVIDYLKSWSTFWEREGPLRIQYVQSNQGVASSNCLTNGKR